MCMRIVENECIKSNEMLNGQISNVHLSHEPCVTFGVMERPWQHYSHGFFCCALGAALYSALKWITSKMMQRKSGDRSGTNDRNKWNNYDQSMNHWLLYTCLFFKWKKPDHRTANDVDVLHEWLPPSPAKYCFFFLNIVQGGIVDIGKHWRN